MANEINSIAWVDLNGFTHTMHCGEDEQKANEVVGELKEAGIEDFIHVKTMREFDDFLNSDAVMDVTLETIEDLEKPDDIRKLEFEIEKLQREIQTYENSLQKVVQANEQYIGLLRNLEQAKALGDELDEFEKLEELHEGFVGPVSYEDDLPEPDHCDVMTVSEFKECCACSGLIDYDGYGHPAKDNKMDRKRYIKPSRRHEITQDSTHIVWFNR